MLERGSLTRTSTSSTISTSSTLVEPCGEKTFVDKTSSVAITPSTGEILSIPAVTAPIKALLVEQLDRLTRPLRIVGLLATKDRGCHQYANLTAKNCKNNGINFEKRDISSCRDASEREAFASVERAIRDLNEDEEVDGAIIYFPLFGPELVRLLLIVRKIRND